MSTALAWLLVGLGVLDPALPPPAISSPSSPTVAVGEAAPEAEVADSVAVDDYEAPPPAAPIAAPASAPGAAPSPVIAPGVAPPQRENATRPAPAADAGFRPTIPVAVASGVGLAGVALGGLTAGLGAERGMRGFSAVALGVGATGFATAGVLLLIGADDERATQVAVSPAAVQVRRAF